MASRKKRRNEHGPAPTGAEFQPDSAETGPFIYNSTPAASASPKARAPKTAMSRSPPAFKETLALHIDARRSKHAQYLFESSWKKPYSTRGVRSMLARYAKQAGLAHNMPPHRLRHFLFTCG
jgi:hypothetical protein